jgi:hypothetical protein
MSLYEVLVFVHVLGAIGIFVALGIESVSLGRLQQEEVPAGVHASIELLALPRRMGPIAMVITLGAGVALMRMGWRYQPWIAGAFVGMIAMALVGGIVSMRDMRRLRVALAAESGAALSEAFRMARSSTALTSSLRLRIAIGIGILGLMTTKPDAVHSSLILAAVLLGGLIATRIRFTTPRRVW